MTTLQRYTWDQAAILQLATANGFRAFELNPATIRWWAAQGLITAVGKAPGGAHLYSIGEVSAASDRPRQKPGPKPRRGSLQTATSSPTIRGER